MTANAICINCDTELTGKYCSGCGQKAHTGRLTLHELFHEVWHALTHTDKGILRLIKDLIVHPAQVYFGYLKGQRKKYFSPVLFFLVTAGLIALAYPYIFDYQDKLFHTNNEFGRELYHTVKYRGFLLLPLDALILWAFFNKRLNYAEVVVFLLFCFGLSYFVQLVCVPLYFPLIAYKKHLDNFMFIGTYALVFAHSAIVFGNKKLGNILLLFLLANFFLMIEAFLDALVIYEKYHYNLLANSHLIWNFLKSMYEL